MLYRDLSEKAVHSPESLQSKPDRALENIDIWSGEGLKHRNKL